MCTVRAVRFSVDFLATISQIFFIFFWLAALIFAYGTTNPSRSRLLCNFSVKNDRKLLTALVKIIHSFSHRKIRAFSQIFIFCYFRALKSPNKKFVKMEEMLPLTLCLSMPRKMSANTFVILIELSVLEEVGIGSL